MKVLHKKSSNVSSNAIGAFKTPGRSYDYSDRFERALVERGILSMNPTMPLFERMWHVNNAELIVTTWGSTLTVLIHILFERQQRADGANFTSQANESRVSRADSDDASHVVPTRPLRILILVHPRYIAETTLLFGKTLGLLSDPQRMPTSLSSPLYSHVVRHRMMRMRGASTDYYGGRDFCVKFVLVHKLDFVGSQELDFHC
ncbi:Hypothetical protein, putative [Bodo saltans]|uniref:Uncharacterized protein n=1 Tax=Bodo saltans TaxID=75058 RepID=A0A0S4J500_BODSA|nr:Hypothetical protein, putative [Bodo saltans]|eukprot:CUG84317.1 Hypothetical protein, putative [Bodo saltans]